jgi:nucleoside-diphosphate-sugar epimerase
MEINSSNKKQTVLITGAAGMIGQNLSKRLIEEGFEVACIDRIQMPDSIEPWWQGIVDVVDRDKLLEVCNELNPDFVIHLAAECGVTAPPTLAEYYTNTQGVENVCEAARATPSIKRVIFTSSQTVCKVGYQPKDDQDYCPESIYGESKVLGEQIVRRLDGGGKPWVIVRPTTVWGAGIDLSYLNQHFIHHIHKGSYCHIGSGALRKSYSYVGNIAHQYFQLIKLEQAAVMGRTLYLADYEPLSLRDFANTLADELHVRRPRTLPIICAYALAYVGSGLCALGLKFPFHRKRLSNMLREYVYDLSETESICGPLPYSMNEGAHIYAEWYAEQIFRVSAPTESV